MLYRRRNKALQNNKIFFFKVNEVIVPGKFKSFLLSDFRDKDCRILLFAIPEGRNALQTAKHVFIEDTFKSGTPPFTQLFTMHVDFVSTNDTNSIIPVVYALSKDKQLMNYFFIWFQVKCLIRHWMPSEMVCLTKPQVESLRSLWWH